MVKSLTPLVTTCTKKGCQKPICYFARFKYKKGLCSEHLAEFEKELAIKQQQKRTKPKKCQICKSIIKTRRNKQYCSADYRRLAIRFVAHSIVCEVTTTVLSS